MSTSEKPLDAEPVNGKFFTSRTKSFGSSVTEDVTVKFVATALGDNVENTAGRSSVFRTISAGLDFNFLHKLERKVCARTAESRVGNVHAIEDVVVLRTRRTRYRRISVAAGCVAQT